MRLSDLPFRRGPVLGVVLLSACCAPVEEESRHVGWLPRDAQPAGRPAPVQPKPPQWKSVSTAAKPQAAAERPVVRKAATVATIDPKVQQVATEIAGELSARCSFASPGDQAAFDDCRKAIGGGSNVRARMAGTALWGYETAEAGKPLKDMTLAALTGEALAGSYLPLFMFSGQNAVTYSDADKLYRVELGARLRNRLAAGQIPAAFTQDDMAWSAYQGTTAVVMWIDPRTLDVRAALPTTQTSFKMAPSAPAPKPVAGGS
jgi:hypothetical protein